MILKQLLAPSLNGLTNGVATPMSVEALDFSPDGLKLLVKVSYLDSAYPGVLRSVVWVYDTVTSQYTISLNELVSTGMPSFGAPNLSQAVYGNWGTSSQIVALLRDDAATNQSIGEGLNQLVVFRDGVLVQTDLVSSIAGVVANQPIINFKVTDNGRYIAFETAADNLGSELDTNGVADIYLLDIQANSITRVTTANGVESGFATTLGDIIVDSQDVLNISFSSVGQFTTTQDINDSSDVFVWKAPIDIDGLVSATSTMTLVSKVGTTAVTGDNSLLSLAGTVYDSVSPQLTLQDTNNATDVFLAGASSVNVVSPTSTLLTGGDHLAAVSASGRYVALLTASSEIAGNTGAEQLVVVDTLGSGGYEVVSQVLGSPANDSVLSPVLSANGAMIAFSTQATNLGAQINPDYPMQLFIGVFWNDPTFTAFTTTVATGTEDNQITVTFANLQAQGNEADVDGTVDAFVIKAVTTGTLLIGVDAAHASAWNAVTNNTVDATHQAYWTPAANANGTLNAFTAVAKDNGGLESATAIQATVSVTAVNDIPTFTAFASTVATGNEDSQIAITFANLKAQGNEADVDGTVDAFVIKAVTTGTLLIGVDAAHASAWNAVTNNTVDATHQAYWTPAANANGTLNAFTAVAKDNGGLESATPVQATVSVTSVNDAPTGSVTITGTATQGQTLTASNNLADVDGLGTISYTWYASESATPIGTGNTFTLTQAQVGKNITVVASYTDLQGTTEFVDSNALQVPATPPVATPIVPDSKNNVIGTSSPDVIDGRSNSKLILVGGAGDDIYIVNNTKAKVTETSGNGSDTVYSSVTFVLGNNLENLVLMGNSNINAKGNSLNNNLIGNNGNNIVDGQAGNDILDGRSGNDTLIGGLGSDTFIISSGTDAIMDLGLGGDSLQVSLGATVNATIKSAWTASSDTLNEGTVNITTKGFAVNVSASTGSDGYSILNTGSASSLVGSAAGDSLKGGKGNDFIIGNAGNDFIYGGAGKDILTGGSGNDTFIFNTTPNKSSNIDTLTDFSSGVDKLQFDKAIFKSIGSTGTLNADAFYANAGATSGHDTTDRFVYNTTSGALYYDADGSGKNVAVQIALIGVASHPDLVVTDFIVA